MIAFVIMDGKIIIYENVTPLVQAQVRRKGDAPTNRYHSTLNIGGRRSGIQREKRML